MQDSTALFTEHTCLRAVIDACLEGKAGEKVAFGSATAAMRLDLGCYSIFGGDSETEEAHALIEGVAANQELVFAGERWKKRILEVHPAATEKTMITFLPGPDLLDISRRHLNRMAPGVDIEPLKPGHEVNERLVPNGFQVHATHAGFFEHGFGFAAMSAGRLVALVSTYCVSRNKAEIAISTDPAFRQKGCATSLGATMLLECERRGLEPHWSASNPVSQRIARRLGFIDTDVCTYLKLDDVSR